jgi:hypothetical protein
LKSLTPLSELPTIAYLDDIFVRKTGPGEGYDWNDIKEHLYVNREKVFIKSWKENPDGGDVLYFDNLKPEVAGNYVRIVRMDHVSRSRFSRWCRRVIGKWVCT